MVSRKKQWTRPWKAHWRHQSIRNCDLWRQRSLHRWWWHIQETQVAYSGRRIGRRKGAEQVVVIWAYSVDLVCLVWFVSKRFVNEIIKWLDYQPNISKSLIIKGLDNQTQLSKYLCLIIKDFDNQAQEPNNQINQSWKKTLICVLGPWCPRKLFLLIQQFSWWLPAPLGLEHLKFTGVVTVT